MGVITDTLDKVDSVVLGFTEAVFSSFAGEITTLATTMGALGIAIIGANLVLQIHPMTMASGVSFILRFTIVILLARSWANFAVIYDLLTELPNRLGAHVMAIGSGNSISSADGLHGAMDDIVDFISDVATDASNRSSLFGISLVGVLIGLLAALLGCVAVLIVSLGKVGLAFMVAIAPLALLASLYRSTKSLFEAWTQATIGFALIPLVTAGLMGIIVRVAQLVVDQSLDQIETIGDAIGLIVVSLAAIFTMTRIPDIVRSLAGSIIAVGSGFTEGRETLRHGRASAGRAVQGTALAGRAVAGAAIAGSSLAPSYRGLSERLGAARARILAGRDPKRPQNP